MSGDDCTQRSPTLLEWIDRAEPKRGAMLLVLRGLVTAVYVVQLVAALHSGNLNRTVGLPLVLGMLVPALLLLPRPCFE